MKRTIIEQEPVRLALNEASSRWSRAEDAWDAVVTVLAHDPDAGTPLTESGKTRALTFQGAKAANMPTITVVYEDQDPFLIIHDVKFSAPTRYIPYTH